MTSNAASNAQNELHQHALRLMAQHPLIDSHVDLPFVMRALSRIFLR